MDALKTLLNSGMGLQVVRTKRGTACLHTGADGTKIKRAVEIKPGIFVNYVLMQFLPVSPQRLGWVREENRGFKLS